MLPQRLVVDARLIVEAVHKGDGIEFYEIFVARFIFCQQDQMLELTCIVLDVQIVRHIHFAADDRLNIIFPALFGKLERRIHIAVVGDRDCPDIIFCTIRHQLLYFAGTVEQAVFGM